MRLSYCRKEQLWLNHQWRNHHLERWWSLRRFTLIHQAVITDVENYRNTTQLMSSLSLRLYELILLLFSNLKCDDWYSKQLLWRVECHSYNTFSSPSAMDKRGLQISSVAKGHLHVMVKCNTDFVTSHLFSFSSACPQFAILVWFAHLMAQKPCPDLRVWCLQIPNEGTPVQKRCIIWTRESRYFVDFLQQKSL